MLKLLCQELRSYQQKRAKSFLILIQMLRSKADHIKEFKN